MQRVTDRDHPYSSGEQPGVRRVALLSVHTCPLDQPGTGDSGGMNVYVRQVAKRLAEMGVEVDVFTRWAGSVERVRTIEPGVRVIHLEAGPTTPIPKHDLPDHLCEFLYALMRFEADEAVRLGEAGPIYDVIHSHYWLSGWVGRLAAERWNVPLIQSFHTLGRVKNRTLAPGDTPEPAARIAAEERIIHTADCVLAPTPIEAAELVRLYGADPECVRVVSPGVDTDVFTPVTEAARAEAKRALGLEGRTVVLFAGRLQPLKSPDVAVQAVADLAALDPELDPVLLVIGGSSGTAGLEPSDLVALGEVLGGPGRVVVRDPVPHAELPPIYHAADVTIVPSRSESFGLVALESEACGTPVVASDVGGLRTAVRHEVSGLLVPADDPAGFTAALHRLLADPAGARAMGEAASQYARRYDWRRAAAGLLEVYEEAVTAVAAG